jgi:hypothetical protein
VMTKSNNQREETFFLLDGWDLLWWLWLPNLNFHLLLIKKTKLLHYNLWMVLMKMLLWINCQHFLDKDKTTFTKMERMISKHQIHSFSEWTKIINFITQLQTKIQ